MFLPKLFSRSISDEFSRLTAVVAACLVLTAELALALEIAKVVVVVVVVFEEIFLSKELNQ